jgi:hypothetical protein
VERQTDGVEWVMFTMFLLAMLIVVVAAVREIWKARRGDPGGDVGGRRGDKPTGDGAARH